MAGTLQAEWRKWWATVVINWRRLLAYKLNFLLLVIGPVLVFFFIRYQVWAGIYRLEGVDTLQGYNFEQMLAYQVWVMIVGFLALGFNGMNLAEEIRLGRISAYLLYPFGFWPFQLASFLAFQGLQLLVASVTLSAVWAMGWVQLQPLALLQGFSLAACVGLFWFQANFVIGILAFWLEETWVLRVMLVTLSQFFSGALIPLELFPRALSEALHWLPFPYLTYVPVKVFMGTYIGSLWQAFAVLLLWTLLVFGLARVVWRQGIHNYTGAGI